MEGIAFGTLVASGFTKGVLVGIGTAVEVGVGAHAAKKHNPIRASATVAAWALAHLDRLPFSSAQCILSMFCSFISSVAPGSQVNEDRPWALAQWKGCQIAEAFPHAPRSSGQRINQGTLSFPDTEQRWVC